MTTQPQPTQVAERRSFLRYLSRGFLSLWGLGTTAMGLIFLRAPSKEGSPSAQQVDCGTLSSLAVGEGRFVRHGLQPFFVVRMADRELLAVSAICTHMRCILQRDSRSGSFLCPCHSGSFDRLGNVQSGPPTRPLDRYRAELRGDNIVVRI